MVDFKSCPTNPILCLGFAIFSSASNPQSSIICVSLFSDHLLPGSLNYIVANMTYSEVCSEVCEHGILSLRCACHLFRNPLNTLEEKIPRPGSANYSSAQLKEYPDGSSVYCSNTKHISPTAANGTMPRLNPHTQTNLPSSVTACRSDVKSLQHSFITTSYGHTKNDKGSYQLQRYLNEPASYQARLINGVAPEDNGMALLGFSRRNGEKRKETRRTAMRRKIKAIERKIGEL